MNRKPKHPIAKHLPTLLVLGMLLAYIAFFTWLSVLAHDRFWTGGYDLGNFDQTVWNTLHGRILQFTNVPHANSRLGLHFEPILVPLSLFYLLWSDPRTLLLIQTIALAFGAIPTYWLGRERLSDWPAVGLVAVYLLFPALEGANLFEFHANTLAVPFLAFAYYYVQHRRYRSFALCAVLAMMCREDAILVVAMMGAYILLVHRDRVGWFALFGGVGAFCLVVLVIIPNFSTTGTLPPLAARYADLGASPGQIVWSVITRPRFVLRYVLSDPDKVRYLTHFMAPVVFLSLLDVSTLLPALPVVVLNLLSDQRATYVLDRFHYSAMIVPFVVFAAINGIDRLVRYLHRWRRISPRFTRTVFTAATVLTSLGYHWAFGHTPIARQFALPQADERHVSAHEMFQLIPDHASVSAQSDLNPHLSQRPAIYLFPKLDDPAAGPAEYIALDYGGNIFPLTPEEYNLMVEEMLTSGEYEVIFDQDGYLLLHRRLYQEAD